MTLQFERFTGKINLKVYDMKGNLIDDLQTYNDMDSSNIDYNMRGFSDGVYLFVVTGKEGVLTKKVVVYNR